MKKGDALLVVDHNALDMEKADNLVKKQRLESQGRDLRSFNRMLYADDIPEAPSDSQKIRYSAMQMEKLRNISAEARRRYMLGIQAMPSGDIPGGCAYR